MTATAFLRVASILSLLFAGGHTLGGLQSWSPAGETEVLQAMRSFRFDAEGASRTYLDFYLGFGWILSVYLLLQAVVLWQLGTLARVEPARVRPLVAVFLLAQVASGVLAWKLIFAIPVVFSALIALSLGAALYAMKPRS
jgi:hypothetical protein